MSKALLAKGVEFKIGEDLDLSQLITELPQLGRGEKEKVEVTTLNDEVRQYIGGISGGQDAIEITCLYDNTTFMALVALMEANTNDNKVSIKFTEDGLSFKFDANVSVDYASTAINEARKMVLKLTPTSKIEITTEK